MNNPKATHPAREAVTVGQLYERVERVGSKPAGSQFAIESITDGWAKFSDGGERHVSALQSPAEYRLLSPVPQAEPCAPDCLAPEWCGFRCDDEFDPRRDKWYAAGAPRIFGSGLTGTPRWCSPACRDARVPPLPAAPVTTGAHRCPSCGVGELEAHSPCCTKKPATNDLGTGAAKNVERKPISSNPTPAPATCVGVKSFPCFGPRALRHTVKGKPPFILCQGHYLHMEATVNTDGLTNVLDSPKYPERIAKPRMQFSPMDDSCLEDAP